MATVLGSLLVTLGMDSANFQRGTTQARGAMARLRDFSIISMSAIAGAATGAAAALLKLGFDGLQTADQIGEAAQRIGIGAEELSRLRYAAQLSGVQFETLETNVSRLNRAIVAASNGTGSAATAFDRMGISVRNSDGTLKSSTQVLQEMARVFSAMPDGVEKSALAMDVFGRSGSAMVLMLNQGEDGLKRLTEEASRFGIVVTDESAEAAGEFFDGLDRTKGAVNALGYQMASALLPHLLSFNRWLIANQDTISATVASIANFAAGVGRAAAVVANAVSWMNDRFGSLYRAASSIINPMQTVVRLFGMFGSGSSGRANNPFTSALSTGLGMARDLVTQVRAGQGGFQLLEESAVSAGTNGGRAIREGVGGALTAANDNAAELQRVLDRLFPDMARATAMARDLALIDGAGLSQSDADRARRAIMAEYDQVGRDARDRTLGGINLGLPEDFALGADELTDAMGRLLGRTQDATTRVARSFRDMANDTLNSLSTMADAIKGGGFLDILGSLIGLGTQLASIGAFGRGLQTRVNATVPGYAKGTNFHPGGLAVVGERGPELLNMPRGSQVVPNHALGGTTRVEVIPSPYFDVRVNENIAQAAPAIASAGAMGGVQRMAYANNRRWRA